MSMLDKLINEELERANEKFPPFQSLHEACAVTFEEVEELREQIEKIELSMKWYWILCKGSKNTTVGQLKNLLDDLDVSIISAFEELIQVAAMIKKARRLQNG